MKPVVWLGDSLARVRDFAPDARHGAGLQPGRVQFGKEPVDWRKTARTDIELARLRFRSLVRDRRQR